MAVQNVQEWVVRAREERGHIKRADPCMAEAFSSKYDITLLDESTVSAATEEDVQAKEMAGAICPHGDAESKDSA
jgi:hypothetical protein